MVIRYFTKSFKNALSRFFGDWRYVCYRTKQFSPGAGGMPQNGERNEKFGSYKSICCGAEIVIKAGAVFPDCPNHQKLTTGWRLVSEAKFQSAETQRADFTRLTTHIENRHLFDLASGRIKLEEWEEQHIHDCKLCQGVLYVLLNQPTSGLTETAPKPADAA
jgi:hypothetical protein